MQLKFSNEYLNNNFSTGFSVEIIKTFSMPQRSRYCQAAEMDAVAGVSFILKTGREIQKVM